MSGLSLEMHTETVTSKIMDPSYTLLFEASLSQELNTGIQSSLTIQQAHGLETEEHSNKKQLRLGVEVITYGAELANERAWPTVTPVLAVPRSSQDLRHPKPLGVHAGRAWADMCGRQCSSREDSGREGVLGTAVFISSLSAVCNFEYTHVKPKKEFLKKPAVSRRD